MQRLTVMALVVAVSGLLLAGCGGGGGSDVAGDSQALLPLAVGSEWHYDYDEYDLSTAAKRAGLTIPQRGHRHLGTRALSAEDVVTVSGTETIGGREWYSVVSRYVGGATSDPIYLRHGAQGLQRKDTLSDPAYYLIHHPITAGTTWKDTFTSEGVQYTETYTIRSTDEAITVAAGTYSGCVLIESVVPLDAETDDVISYWYAPDVGEVREERHIGAELYYELALNEYAPASTE